ncbi:MAG: L-ribulose-5-phosphate 4-epimerase [Melioribacteraceae bacterium]|nr:L-ribulose-5-phosphate 4-epimerase [Melioribacteraceae bacterium]
MSLYKELKEKVCLLNLKLYESGLVIQTFGNLSGIDRAKGIFAIKPSGISYESLTPDDIVIVDLENRIVEGELNPSSDSKTHSLLYKSFPKIGGIVHTHSPYATAWAQAKNPIPCFGTTHADHNYGEIPCTDELTNEQINGDYETETGKVITRKFENLSSQEIEMVLVANHGPFTWGKSPEAALKNSILLEEISKMALFTKQINPEAKNINKSLMDKHYKRKHGESAYYGQK